MSESARQIHLITDRVTYPTWGPVYERQWLESLKAWPHLPSISGRHSNRKNIITRIHSRGCVHLSISSLTGRLKAVSNDHFTATYYSQEALTKTVRWALLCWITSPPSIETNTIAEGKKTLETQQPRPLPRGGEETHFNSNMTQLSPQTANRISVKDDYRSD